MIIKGGSCGGPGRLAAHLLRSDHNERVEVAELRGTAAADLRGALADLAALSAGTQCRRPLYHASLNSRAEEVLTAAQRAAAIDRLEAALGLTGQPRAVVVHEKDGREHTHVVWARADAARGRVVSDSHNYRRHEAVARELEQAFGHVPVPGVHVDRQGDGQERRTRPTRTPAHAEMQQAARTAMQPDQARAAITALWRGTATGQAFAAALKDAGWLLCRGDRRDYVLLDPAGEVHGLARRIEGVRAADIRARLADIDPTSLPSVAAARDAMRGASAAAAGKVVKFPALSRRRRLAKADAATRPGARGRAQRQDADVGAALPRQQGRPGTGKRSGQAGGFYVTVSRQRTDFSRPLLQTGANSNSSPLWTPARITGLGQFRALARIMVAPVPKAAKSEPIAPMRPVAASPVERPDTSHEDAELAVVLATIADEVQARADALCAGIAAEFAGRIRLAKTMLSRHHAAAAVAALKQVKREAVRFVRESAASEIRGRQKRVRFLVRGPRAGFIKRGSQLLAHKLDS